MKNFLFCGLFLWSLHGAFAQSIAPSLAMGIARPLSGSSPYGLETSGQNYRQPGFMLDVSLRFRRENTPWGALFLIRTSSFEFKDDAFKATHQALQPEGTSYENVESGHWQDLQLMVGPTFEALTLGKLRLNFHLLIGGMLSHSPRIQLDYFPGNFIRATDIYPSTTEFGLAAQAGSEISYAMFKAGQFFIRFDLQGVGYFINDHQSVNGFKPLYVGYSSYNLSFGYSYIF